MWELKPRDINKLADCIHFQVGGVQTLNPDRLTLPLYATTLDSPVHSKQ